MGAARQGFSAAQPTDRRAVARAGGGRGSRPRLAGEMGRLVFAVPGSPLDPRAVGSNKLLKEGAILVTEARDVLDQIAPLAGVAPQREPLPIEAPPDFPTTPPPGEDARTRVAEALGPTPTDVDDVIRHTGLHPARHRH